MANWTPKRICCPKFPGQSRPPFWCWSRAAPARNRRSCHCFLPSDLSGAPMNINPSPSKIPFLPVTGRAQPHLGLRPCQLIFIIPETAVAAWPVGDSLRREALLSAFLQFCTHKLFCVTAAVCFPSWYFCMNFSPLLPLEKFYFLQSDDVQPRAAHAQDHFQWHWAGFQVAPRGQWKEQANPSGWGLWVLCNVWYTQNIICHPLQQATGSQRCLVGENGAWPLLSA